EGSQCHACEKADDDIGEVQHGHVGTGEEDDVYENDAEDEAVEQASAWEEDRKFVLRGWCLVFNILATLMLFGMLDGHMAYLQGSYTGYLGFWTNCGKHKCTSLGQVTVLIHMSMGFMIVALILCLLLLLAMGFSFRPVFRRLNKADLIFSSLSFCIVGVSVLGLSLSSCFPLFLSAPSWYLLSCVCVCARALVMEGTLSYLNYVGMWGKRGPSTELRVSRRRCVSQQSTLKSKSEQQ
ncbi:hypothetical protein E2I00_005833, partial [Balaenoptera physalus]